MSAEAPPAETTIRPIPPGVNPGPIGRLAASVPPEPAKEDHKEPEQEQDEQEEKQDPNAPRILADGRVYFAGRTWDNLAAIQSAHKAMLGRENPKDARIKELEASIAKQEGMLEVLSKVRDKMQDGEPTTKADKQEIKSFLQLLTKEDTAQYEEDVEAKGALFALSRILHKMEGHQSSQINDLKNTIAELKRSLVDEPAAVDKESEEWAQGVYELVHSAIKIGAEGTGPVAEAFAKVFPPDAPVEKYGEATNEIMDTLLHFRMEPTKEAIYFATLAQVGYNSLESNPDRKKAKVRRPAEDEDDEVRTDPSIPATRAGSRPRTREAESDFLAGTRSTASTGLGKLARSAR